MSLKTPDAVADKIVEMCLPSFQESGRIYNYRAGKLLDFQPPA